MSEAAILIVEDNPKNLKLIRAVLQAEGYATLEAKDGQAAIDLARDRRPVLILMDIQLPGLDGESAMKALKENPNTRNIPVVALTALAMKGDRERFLQQGFDGYIAKPIDVDEALATVGEFL